jgi:hypothetical protein
MDTLSSLQQQITALVAKLIEFSDYIGRTEADLAQTERDAAAAQAEVEATQAKLVEVKDDLFAVKLLSPEQFRLLHVPPDQFYYQQDLDREFYAATKALTDLTLREEKTKLELPALKAKVAELGGEDLLMTMGDLSNIFTGELMNFTPEHPGFDGLPTTPHMITVGEITGSADSREAKLWTGIISP